ncbi:DUF3299 domain-containing protein [uncultured Methylibium sp.]|uniref:DUF3299 domain-containing protein n=1 Tax=uncultured Methylibium sp. TaxID=381093 RepID=UPI0025EA9875|nr:DUF3299 domain-containing protein [uncultured Methylibium sp.]
MPSHLSTMNRRALLVLGAATLLARPGLAADVRDLPWEELVPKGWDPMAGFKRPPNMGLMSDADPRMQELMRALRESWDQAPTRPELDGKAVQISGYLVPLEQARGEVSEFLLVPYFGACIHTPPPPANQIVHVLPARPAKGLRAMEVVTVRGKLSVARSDSAMGVSAYRIDGAAVEICTPPDRTR